MKRQYVQPPRPHKVHKPSTKTLAVEAAKLDDIAVRSKFNRWTNSYQSGWIVDVTPSKPPDYRRRRSGKVRIVTN
jgi:hypothetical protein